MQKMNQAEIDAFLMGTARTGKLATVRADGRPHVAPIWYIVDGDRILFNTWHESVKAKNIEHDNRVALCVDDEEPPYRYVIVEGTVELTTPPPEVNQKWAGAIAGRYMGADRAEAFGKRNGVAGELLCVLTPDKVIAYKNISD